jgi:hypothetical protein
MAGAASGVTWQLALVPPPDIGRAERVAASLAVQLQVTRTTVCREGDGRGCCQGDRGSYNDTDPEKARNEQPGDGSTGNGNGVLDSRSELSPADVAAEVLAAQQKP